MEITTNYYGNRARTIFIACGLLMIFTRPFFDINLSSGLFYSILTILVLTFVAGIARPQHFGIAMCDILISILGFGIFVYQSMIDFYSFVDLFFIVNLVLSILFLVAFYWSVRTIRFLWIEARPSLKYPSHHKDDDKEDNLPVPTTVATEHVEEKEKTIMTTGVTKEAIVIPAGGPAESTPIPNQITPEAVTIIIPAGTEPELPSDTATKIKPQLTEEERRKSRFLSSEG